MRLVFATAIAMLTLIALAGCERGPQVERTVLSSKPIASQRSAIDDGDNPRGDGNRDAPNINLDDLPPPIGNSYHVWSRANDAGDGSAAHPWRDLQAALCELAPGDRLIILAGVYRGPFRIDADCASGSLEAPIEVYAVDDALLTAGEDAPVLEIGAEHWHINGIEIAPGRVFSPAVRIAGGAHLTFENCHLHSGTGDGVFIGPGSQDIEIRDCHIHQLGMHDEGQPYLRPENPDAAGVRVAPGTRDITITRTRLHNIRGGAIVIVDPETWASETGETLPEAENVMADGNLVEKRQAQW